MSHGSDSALHHQFDDLHQQKTSVTLGMWLFLAQEVMFFGGLFLVYAFYRYTDPAAFVAASLRLDVGLGAVNTVVLIGSSLTMALAVHAAAEGQRAAIRRWILATMLLGGVFLAIKGYEYHHKWVEQLVPGAGFVFDGPHHGHAHIFYILYFTMTGMHALHMVVGMGIMVMLLVQNAQGRFTKSYSTPVEMTGLYWHFVDIVWIFLFPLLYLIARV